MSAETFSLGLFIALCVAGGLSFSAKKPAAVGFLAVAVTAYILLSSKGFIVVGTILFMIVLSTPLFAIIGCLSFALFYFLTADHQTFESFGFFTEQIFALTGQNVLLAIPFFVIAGSIMTAGGIARRVVDFADALIGWLPGGLAAAAVLSCMFFAAISGSSPVTVIAIGSIMVPALVSAGYDDKFSVGLVTSAGSLGILIPPSIPMIVYSIVVPSEMKVDVADLFIAGLVPGMLIGALLVSYSVVKGAARPDFSWSTMKPPSLRLIGRRFVEGFWALLLPVIVLGGIYPIFGPTGIFTPTEAAAVSVIYAFVVEKFIHRELEVKKLPELLVESTIVMGALLIILMLSFALNYYMSLESIPDIAVQWLKQLDLEQVTFLLMLNLFLLMVGALMDIVSAILIIAPLVAPIAASFAIDPIHLGIIFVVNLEIGYLTPPIGLNLFVSASLFKKPIGFVIRSVVVFTGLMLIGLAIITWFEPTSVGLVRSLHGEPFMGKPKTAPAPGATDEDEEADDEGTSGAEPGIKSIEELMKDAQGGDDEDDEDDDDEEDEEDEDPARIKSIEELMKAAAGSKTSTAQE